MASGAGASSSSRGVHVKGGTLADAFHHTLQDVYFAEHALVKALPKVIKAVFAARSQDRATGPSGRDENARHDA